MAMIKNKAFSLREEIYQLPNAELVTANGSKTTLLKELDTENIVILNFIFTTCMATCPIRSGTFSEVNKNPVKIISISIDPQYDMLKTLRTYAKIFNANKNWNFYIGTTRN